MFYPAATFDQKTQLGPRIFSFQLRRKISSGFR